MSQAEGSTPFSLAVPAKLATTAQLRAPAFEPANELFLRPKAIGRTAPSTTRRQEIGPHEQRARQVSAPERRALRIQSG